MRSQQQLPVVMPMISVREWQMLISNLDSQENKRYVHWEVEEEYLPQDANRFWTLLMNIICLRV